VTGATLVTDGLGVRAGRGWLFDGLSLSVAPGEIVRVLAPPGPGRTACALALAGHVPADAGTRALAGGRLNGPDPRVRIGWVPGRRRFNRRKTVGDVLQSAGLLGASEATKPDLAVLSLGSHARYRVSGQPPLIQALLGAVAAAAFDTDVLVMELPPGLLEHQAAADAVVTSFSRRGIGVIAATTQHLSGAAQVVLRSADAHAA
jgi:hypothetical protein